MRNRDRVGARTDRALEYLEIELPGGVVVDHAAAYAFGLWIESGSPAISAVSSAPKTAVPT
jgi:hypothetical protein